MLNRKRTRTGLWRSAVSPLLALGAALFVVLTLVAPVLAVEGPTKLTDARVSPRTGTPSTTISFSVKYRNREGSAADHVSVVIDGVAHVMRSAGGTNWKGGITHTWATTLPAGTHKISFQAADTRKFTDSVDGGSVTIKAPAPTSKPDPTPTPRPEPTATSPDATPAPGPTSGGTDGTGSGGTGDPTDGPGAGAPGGTDSVGGTSDPDDPRPINVGFDPGSTGGGDSSAGGAGGSGTPGAGTIGWSHGSDPGLGGPAQNPAAGATSDDANATNGGSAAAGTGPDGRATSGGPGWGALASALETLGIERPPALATLPLLVGTSGAMTMAFAFAIFGKKRRDEAPPAPDEVLQANAARGHGALPGSDAINGVVAGAAVPAPFDLEAGMPRWRRPSVLEARKADPTRSTASNHHMTFDSGHGPGVEGRERRMIRYSVVRLLDAPDELRSAEIGQLDRGDEVILIERSGTYWLVLCPDGRQGWLHKMTLGEVVSDAAPSTASPFNREDEDGLAAFLTARAQGLS